MQKTFKFPDITHISQVKPFIANSKEFAIAAKDAFTYICYKRVMLDTFPPIPSDKDIDSPEFLNAIVRLECRGLVFDNRTGQLKSRSFHKFFNVGEREDSRLDLCENIFKQAQQQQQQVEQQQKQDDDRSFYILEKLDGSMCTPILEPVKYFEHVSNKPNKISVLKRLRFRTKMGFDNVTSQAIELFIYGHTDEEKYPLFLDEEDKLPDAEQQAIFDEQVKQVQQLQQAAASATTPLPPSASVLKPAPVEFYKVHPSSEIPQEVLTPNSMSQLHKLSTQRQPVIDFCVKWLLQGYNPIFEFFDPNHKIVIDYGAPFIQLLSLRHITTGQYVDFATMQEDAKQMGVPIVNEWLEEKKQIKSIADLMALVKVKSGKEGCVIRFKDGRMFKVKSKWYNDLHRCKQHLKWNAVKESHVWNLVLEDKIDDTLPTLDTDQEREKIREFNDKLLKAIEKQVENINKIVAEAKKGCNNQREFANLVNAQYSTKQNFASMFPRILFKVYAGEDTEAALIDCIKTSMKKGPCDEARKLLGDETVKFEKLEQVDYLEYVKERKEKQAVLKAKQTKSFETGGADEDDDTIFDEDN